MTGAERAAEPVPLVLVVAGTDFHPFDRLVTWADEWFSQQPSGSVRCLVQFGYSEPPTRAEGVAFLQYDDLAELIAVSRAVVCHGGPSSISEACRRGRLPVVVPRDPVRGEHVDGHQQRFARFMARRSLIRLAEDRAAFVEQLSYAIDDHYDHLALTTEADTVASAKRLGALVDELLARSGPERAVTAGAVRRLARGGWRTAARGRR